MFTLTGVLGPRLKTETKEEKENGKSQQWSRAEQMEGWVTTGQVVPLATFGRSAPHQLQLEPRGPQTVCSQGLPAANFLVSHVSLTEDFFSGVKLSRGFSQPGIVEAIHLPSALYLLGSWCLLGGHFWSSY